MIPVVAQSGPVRGGFRAARRAFASGGDVCRARFLNLATDSWPRSKPKEFACD